MAITYSDTTRNKEEATKDRERRPDAASVGAQDEGAKERRKHTWQEGTAPSPYVFL